MVELRGLEEAPLVETRMTPWERFLGVLADPTLASILISIGFLGLIFEMSNPGMIVPGAAGVIAILLGFLGFGVLPVDTVGLMLLLVGLAMVAMELFLPGGILGAAGLVAIVLGGIIAFRDTPAELRPPLWLVGLLAFFLTGIFVSLAISVARVKNLTAAMGTSALIGKTAVVRTPLSPEGYVFIQGERWRAQVDRGSAKEGDRVRIVGADGFLLRVRKEETQ
jgi:membrane-bound serine protease (ClpP class)